MKLQNIFRMQVMVVGFGAALLLASSARAQEIENTNWADSSSTVSAAQEAPAPTAGQLDSLGADSQAPSPAAAASKTLVAQETFITHTTLVEGWVIASLLACIALVGLYAREDRKHRKMNGDRTARYLNNRIALP
jgi:hypothetical protein